MLSVIKSLRIVFREILAREKNIPIWRELLVSFRRLEDRGEVRGGRFINTFAGEQFALPQAVESLRRSAKDSLTNESFCLHPADPLYLSGNFAAWTAYIGF